MYTYVHRSSTAYVHFVLCRPTDTGNKKKTTKTHTSDYIIVIFRNEKPKQMLIPTTRARWVLCVILGM